MTKLIIAPIDPDAEGALDRAIEFMELAADLSEAMQGSSLRDQAAALRKARRALALIATTDDGTPVEDALRRLSITEFNAMFASVMQGGDPVPPASGELSRSTTGAA